jgi:hypothetical protein
MRDGRIRAQGPPAAVVTEPVIAGVFDVSCVVIDDPVTGTPLCVRPGPSCPATASPTGAEKRVTGAGLERDG